MALVNRMVQDGASVGSRVSFQGDLVNTAEFIDSSLVTVGAGVITAAQLSNSVLLRSGPTGAYTDTTDTAANIIADIVGNVFIGTGAVQGGVGSSGGAQPGSTWRLRYINSVAFAMTLVAGTGVTLGSNVNVAASSVKDYLITVTNGTPAQVFNATVDGSTTVITGLSQWQTAQLSVGQLVTGTGIPAAAKVISVQNGIGVTISANTTAAGASVSLTFAPTVRIDSLGQMLL